MLRIVLGTMLALSLTAASGQSQSRPPTPAPRTAEQLAPFELGKATVQALSYAATGRDLIANIKPEGNAIADSLNALVAHRGAISRLRQAIMQFSQFKDSKDKQVLEAVDHMQLVLENLSAALGKSVALWEKFATTKTAEAIAALVPEGGKVLADIDEAWRLLPIGVASVTHALVDTDRMSPTRTLSYLRVTREERAKILADLKTFFPKAAQTKTGHLVDMTASLFVEFLNGVWKNADDK